MAVIGGGIVGLAVARELMLRSGTRDVCVFEREPRIAMHQTSHNSGVIHAGVYYSPGSLKAQLCAEGARALYEYCESRGIACERSGKVIVATDSSELARLDELERRARANRVPAIRRLDAEQIMELEPHVRGVAGLHSPTTGIVDFAAMARAFAEDITSNGGRILTGCEVRETRAVARRIRIRHTLGETEAVNAIFCAGAWADRLAVAAGASPDPRIVPFRGAYLRLVPERSGLVRSLVYPVPDPSLPFLGVHLTRRLDGDVLIGPTAMLVAARDAYRLWRVRRRDVFETLSWPGTWRMLARQRRTAADELRQAVSRRALIRAAARYVPELRAGDVEPAFAGIRAQALTRGGRLVDDFAFSRTDRALHVRNAPSPAATSSLAIARHVADEAEQVLGLRD